MILRKNVVVFDTRKRHSSGLKEGVTRRKGERGRMEDSEEGRRWRDGWEIEGFMLPHSGKSTLHSGEGSIILQGYGCLLH